MIYNFFTDEKETRQERLSSMLRIPWIEPVSNGGNFKENGKEMVTWSQDYKETVKILGGTQ